MDNFAVDDALRDENFLRMVVLVIHGADDSVVVLYSRTRSTVSGVSKLESHHIWYGETSDRQLYRFRAPYAPKRLTTSIP